MSWFNRLVAKAYAWLKDFCLVCEYKSIVVTDWEEETDSDRVCGKSISDYWAAASKSFNLGILSESYLDVFWKPVKVISHRGNFNPNIESLLINSEVKKLKNGRFGKIIWIPENLINYIKKYDHVSLIDRNTYEPTECMIFYIKEEGRTTNELQ